MGRLQKATKKKSKLRVLLEGASGSGKTYSGLVLAKPFGRVAVIDTENGSASLYSDKFDFDVLELEPPYSPERYIEAIREVEESGEYDVLVIDSISPEWQGDGGCLDLQSKLGGRFQDWAKVTPRHQKFIDTILQSPLHIIATCRSKTDYKMDENTKKVTKAGTAPQQRDGMDYEFTTVFMLNQHHIAEAQKDRTSIFDGKEAVITDATGKALIGWLNSGAEPPAPKTKPEAAKAEKADPKFVKAAEELAAKINGEPFWLEKLLSKYYAESFEDITKRDEQTAIYNELKALAS